MATKRHTPVGRGYKTGLTYFDLDTVRAFASAAPARRARMPAPLTPPFHARRQDFWTEAKQGCGTKKAPATVVDMWLNQGPGIGYNGSQACSQTEQAGCAYQDDVFTQRVLDIIANYTGDAPLFLFWAPHAPHDPYQAPDAYLSKFAKIDQPERQFYSAMVNLLDDNVGKVVAALKAKGLWDNMLLVGTSDNGGPEGDGYGANNWPLRGGKSSNWQGGVRVNAFAAGGAVPPSRRGTTESGLIEIADWYTTFCGLAGVDPADPEGVAAGLFPPDGLDMWPLLSGANTTSPRQYVVLGSSDTSPQAGNTTVQGVIRNDGFKLLLGNVENNWWTGPVYPNSTTYPTGHYNCGGGCLFNIFDDPTEHNEISAQHPDVVAQLAKVVKAQRVYSPDRGSNDGEACTKALNIHEGFYGPFIDKL